MIVKMNIRNGSLRKLNFGKRQNQFAASRRHAYKEQVNRNKASCLENSIHKRGDALRNLPVAHATNNN